MVLSQALFSSWRSQKSTSGRNEEVGRNIFQLILVSKVNLTAYGNANGSSFPCQWSKRNPGLKHPADDRHHRDKPGGVGKIGFLYENVQVDSLQNSNLDQSGYTPELCRLCPAVSSQSELEERTFSDNVQATIDIENL